MDAIPDARAALARSSTSLKSVLPCSQSMKTASKPRPPPNSTRRGVGNSVLQTATVPPLFSRFFSLGREIRGQCPYVVRTRIGKAHQAFGIGTVPAALPFRSPFEDQHAGAILPRRKGCAQRRVAPSSNHNVILNLTHRPLHNAILANFRAGSFLPTSLRELSDYLVLLVFRRSIVRAGAAAGCTHGKASNEGSVSWDWLQQDIWTGYIYPRPMRLAPSRKSATPLGSKRKEARNVSIV